jgi:hypothetical protein
MVKSRTPTSVPIDHWNNWPGFEPKMTPGTSLIVLFVALIPWMYTPDFVVENETWPLRTHVAPAGMMTATLPVAFENASVNAASSIAMPLQTAPKSLMLLL